MLLVPATGKERDGRRKRAREEEDAAAAEKYSRQCLLAFAVVSLFFLFTLLSVIVRAECNTHKPNSSSFYHYLLVRRTTSEDKYTPPSKRLIASNFCLFLPALLAAATHIHTRKYRRGSTHTRCAIRIGQQTISRKSLPPSRSRTAPPLCNQARPGAEQTVSPTVACVTRGERED